VPVIRITRQTVCGRRTVRPGDLVDASDADARYLIAIGKAQPAQAGAQPAATQRSRASKGQP